MLSRTKKRDFIILVVAGLFFGLGYLYTIYIETPAIKKNFSTTTGFIYELEDEEDEIRDMVQHTRYKYTVNGKEYERGSYDMKPCDGFESHIAKIKGFKYTIAYHNNDPEKSRILVSPKEFEEFSIPYPETQRSFYEQYWSCKE